MAGPLDEKLDRIALAIGHLTMNFAQLEGILNANLAILHQLYGNPPLPERAALRRRIESLREGLMAADISEEGRQHGLDIAAAVTTLSDIRHTCIHSAVAFGDIEETDPLGVTFDKMSHTRPARTMEHMFIGDIDKASQRAFALTAKLLGLVAILDKRQADRVNDTLREMVGQG